MQGNLFGKEVWPRALALFTLTGNDLKNIEILKQSLLLLDDNTVIHIPEQIREQEGKKLKGYLENGWKDATEGNAEQEYIMAAELFAVSLEEEAYYETDRKNAVYMISTLATSILEKYLSDISTLGSEKILHMLIKLISNKNNPRAAKWVDTHFFNFQWQEPQAALKKYISALIKTGYALGNTICKAGEKNILWLAEYAARQPNPSWQVFKTICQCYKEKGIQLVIDVLSVSEISLDESCLKIIPYLLRLYTITKNQKRIHTIIKRVQPGERPIILGYLSLFEPRAATEFRRWLTGAKDSVDQLELDRLSNAIEPLQLPAHFPLREIILAMGINFALEHKSLLIKAFGSENRAYLALSDHAQYKGEDRVPLIRLAEAGLLRDDARRAAKFFNTYFYGYGPFTVDGSNTKRGTPYLSGMLRDIQPQQHTLFIIAQADKRPPGFRQALINYLKDRFILASLAATCLTPWQPQSAEIHMVRQAVDFELDMFEIAYWYEAEHNRLTDSLKSQAIDTIKKGWRELKKLCQSIGHTRALARIDAAMAGRPERKKVK